MYKWLHHTEICPMFYLSICEIIEFLDHDVTYYVLIAGEQSRVTLIKSAKNVSSSCTLLAKNSRHRLWTFVCPIYVYVFCEISIVFVRLFVWFCLFVLWQMKVLCFHNKISMGYGKKDETPLLMYRSNYVFLALTNRFAEFNIVIIPCTAKPSYWN